MVILKRISPLLVVMGLIFYMSHQPGDLVEIDLFRNADKLAHATAFLTLAMSALFASQLLIDQLSPYQRYGFVLIFCLLFGISDEWHQSFIPFRTPSAGDLMADTVGCIAGIVFWHLMRWNKQPAPLRHQSFS